jgi:predicted DsbA family dithiol-disulfide isomerase
MHICNTSKGIINLIEIMKVEIWSDVVCPFCYIGKRRFEQALEKFTDKEKVEVVWKSYQLDPATQHIPGMSIHEYLAERKGFSVEQAKEMNDYVTSMANEVGLMYDFSKTVIANTFDAHRFAHLAVEHNLQDKAEERLFAAYFIEVKNIQDKETLIQLGTELGLEADEVRNVLASNEFSNEVRKDIIDAQNIGVKGVPFFVFNNKYAICGAQATETFLQVLEKTREEELPLTIVSGNSCDIDGECQ